MKTENKQNEALNKTDVSGSLIGYWFLDEYQNEVTILHIYENWCIVKDDYNDKPYLLELEYVQTIKDESDKCLDNDR